MDPDSRQEIEKLEARIEDIAARIESCRKFILAGQVAVVGGGIGLIALIIGAIQFDGAVMALAIAAVLGGIVVAGSNRSSAGEAAHELITLEKQRSTLIGQLHLQLVPGRER
jgi:hypothetical protein